MKIDKIINIPRRIYILFFLIGLLSVSSCNQDFGDINKSWESKLYTPNIPGLTNDLISRIIVTSNHKRIPTAWLHQWNQSAAMYSVSGYRLDDNTTQPWEQFYRALANSIDIHQLIADSENPDSYRNISAIVKVLIAEKALENTLLYGDLPYTEAGKGFQGGEFYRPSYDSQQSVFESALNDLGWAVDNLSVSDSSQESLGNSDTLFQNDINMWIIFANSLRLKYAMVMRDANPSFADPIIAEALNKPLLAPEDQVSLGSANIPNLDINRDGFYRGNAYIRMGSTMWEAMSSTNAVDGSDIYDLRCDIFFEPNKDDEWIPYPQNPASTTPAVDGDPYQRSRLDNWDTNRSNFAALNVYYINDRTIPQLIVTGSEVSFIKAELYNRGIAGVSADPAAAETYYIEGIKASVKYWYKIANESPVWVVNKPDPEPTDAEMTAMLEDPEIAYSTDPVTALEQIYKQHWIALFHQPFAAWDLQRRTKNGTPGVPLTSSLVMDFNRLTYPPSERETNRENWNAVTGGTDSETKEIWIQKY